MMISEEELELMPEVLYYARTCVLYKPPNSHKHCLMHWYIFLAIGHVYKSFAQQETPPEDTGNSLLLIKRLSSIMLVSLINLCFLFVRDR